MVYIMFFLLSPSLLYKKKVMKRRLSISLFVFVLISFSSCAVTNALLGLNECAEPGCDREAEKNSAYCGFHGGVSMPDNYLSNTKKSIDKQTEYQRRKQGF